MASPKEPTIPPGDTLPQGSGSTLPSRPTSSSVSSVHFLDPPQRHDHDTNRKPRLQPSLDAIRSDDLSPAGASQSLSKARSAAPLAAVRHVEALSRSPSLPTASRQNTRSHPDFPTRPGGGLGGQGVLRRHSLVTGGYESSDSDSDPSTRPIRTDLPRPLPTSSTLPNIRDRDSPRKLLYPRSRIPMEREASQVHSRMSSTKRAARGPSQSRSHSHAREITSSPDSRKGKERAVNGLAASLGIDNISQQGLTSDQINDLLNDTDVVSALRMMNNSNLAARLSAARQDAHTGASPGSTTSERSEEPYIVRAPPALYQDASPQPRDRDVSNASTIASNWAASNAAHAAHRRASTSAQSRRLSRSEATGHIPFTHPTPIVTVDEHVASEDESEHPSAPITNGAVDLERDASSKSSMTDMKRSKSKHRISNLFHLKKRTASQPINDSEVQSTTSKSEREDVKAREQEALEKDLEMRRKEAERREEELLQERRFRALTQVAAHPDSERLAYRTSSHLRNVYSNIYDGIENPPRLNPLAVLRWKQRTQEQAEIRARWDKSERPTSLSSSVPKAEVGWRYTMEDVTAYKESKGVVNYFVPPRAQFDAASSQGQSSDRPRDSLDSGPSSKKQAYESKVSLGSGLTSGEMEKASILSYEPPTLSRAGSVDRRRDPRLSHHTHHSLGAIGPATFAQALKNPFERINRKRNGSLKEDYDSQSPVDHTRLKLNRSVDAGSTGAGPGRGSGSLTDDDHRDFHLRDFISRAFDARKSPDMSNPHKERQAELRALQLALEKETALRERQNEDEKRIRLKKEAQERMKQIESEVYNEKRAYLENARRRLDSLDLDLDDSDEVMKHYLVQTERLAQVAHTSFNVTARFPDLDELRKIYGGHREVRHPARRDSSSIHRPTRRDTPTGAMSDVLSPLRRTDSGSDSRHRRSSSMTRRRSTSTHNQPSIFSYGVNPFPRRTSIDVHPVSATGSSSSISRRIEPVERVELTLEQAREARSAMLVQRSDAARQLQAMIGRIDALMKQKDAVRSWTKAALESNRILRMNMEALNAEVMGNNRAKMRRLRDQLIDFSLRQGVGQVFKFFYRIWYVIMWALSWRTPSARRNLRDEQRGWKGVPWGTTMSIFVVIGLVVVFYRLGE